MSVCGSLGTPTEVHCQIGELGANPAATFEKRQEGGPGIAGRKKRRTPSPHNTLEEHPCILGKIEKHFGEDLTGKRFALWGLAFKPDTDDMREAPSRVIMEGLWSRGATVAAFDPVAEEETRHIYGTRPDLVFAGDAYQTLQGADALIVVTEWKIFRSPDYTKMESEMRGRVIFDGRNIFQPEVAREHGFTYFGIGR